MKRNFRVRLLLRILLISPVYVSLPSCKEGPKPFDASGTFEATETIVSAQGNGVIKAFTVREGQSLDSGQLVGYIDTVQLFLKKKQLEAQVRAMGYKLPDIAAQTASFTQQAAVVQSKLDYLLHEKSRMEKLVKADAATPQQLDGISAQVEEAQQQIKAIHKQGEAQASALQTQRSGISAEVQPLYYQIRQLEDQLEKSKIINPLKGTVLTTFAQQSEMASTGKPLYSIANLSSIILRAYLTGDQYASVRQGQQVRVLVDTALGKTREYEGTIEWISDKAEFTPKTIQTKEERANLVYAVKIRVRNDGMLKIGMYGEIKLK